MSSTASPLSPSRSPRGRRWECLRLLWSGVRRFLWIGAWLPALADGGRILSIEELASRADVVAVGRIESLESTRDGSGHPYTRMELAASQIWKGSATNRLSLVSASTVLGDRWVQVVGEKPYRLGEELLIFAVRNAEGDAVVLDPVQGRFRIHGDPGGGEPHAENGLIGETDAIQGAAVRTPLQRRLPLSILRERVKQTAHRPPNSPHSSTKSSPALTPRE